MAWEWVAPVAAASVGVAGIVFTWLSGKQGRDHAKELAKAQQDHSEKAATTARTQDRRAEAYVKLLETVEQVGFWAQNVNPPIDTVPPQALPPGPELMDQIASRARLLAFGSSHVQSLWEEWHRSVEAIRQADSKLAVSERPGSRFVAVDIMGELEEKLRPDEGNRRKQLAARMNQELAG